MAQVHSCSEGQVIQVLFPKRVKDAVLDAISDHEKLSMPLLEDEEIGRQFAVLSLKLLAGSSEEGEEAMKETCSLSLTLFVLTITIIQAAYAQVYKCEDASGKTVYSGTPCSTELPFNEQEIQVNANVLDSSGSRSLHQSIQRQARSESFDQSTNTQNQGNGGKLTRQRQLGQKWIQEAREISSRAGRESSLIDRSAQNRYSSRLQESAAIVLSARQESNRAVEMLTEANSLAKRATRERKLQSRAALFRQSSHLQQSARALLGSQSGSSVPSSSSATHKSSSPSVITNCDGAGCVDNLGNRYHRAAGSTYVPAAGGPACKEIGGMMHCP